MKGALMLSFIKFMNMLAVITEYASSVLTASMVR